MKKYIEIPAEALENIENDKYVKGSLHKCKLTGKIVFRAYNRLSRKKRDRIIRQLGLVNVAMHRDLKDAMSTLEVRDLINRV